MESDPLLRTPNQPDPDYENGHVPTRKRYRPLIVEPILILYFLGWTPRITLMQQYVHARFQEDLGFSGHTYSNDTVTQCYLNKSSGTFKEEQHVQATSSSWLLYYDIIGIIPSFLTIMFLGAYSDKRGRRLLLILSSLGEFCTQLSVYLTILFHLPLAMTYIGQVIQAFMGGPSAMLMAVFAYVSDITTHEERTFRIVVLEICLGVGAVTSELALGPAIQKFGYMWPLVPCMLFQVINMLYVTLFVPETIVPDVNSKVFSLDYVKGTFLVYFRDNGTARRWKLQLCIIILVLIGMVELGTSDVMTLFLIDAPLCWKPASIGYFVVTIIHFALYMPVHIN